MTFRFVPANVEFADGYDFKFPASWSISEAFLIAFDAFIMHYLPCEYDDADTLRAYSDACTYKVYLTFDGRDYFLYKVHYGVS